LKRALDLFASLARRFGFAAVLVAGGRLAYLVLFAVAARLVAPEKFGAFVVALSASQLVAPVATLGLGAAAQAVIPQACGRALWRIRSYVQLSLWITGLVSLAIAVLAALAAYVLNAANIGAAAQTVLVAFAILVAPMAFSTLRAFVARALENVFVAFFPRDIGWTLLLAVLVISVPWVREHLIVSAALTLAAVEMTGWLVLWWRYIAPIRPPRRKTVKPYRRWISRSQALMVNYLGGLGFERLDVIAVGMFASLEVAGIYGAASRVAPVISLSQRFIVPVITPRISRAFGEKDLLQIGREVRFGVLAGGAIAIPATVVTLLFGGEIMRLFGPTFVSGTEYLRILAAGHLAIAIGSNFGVVTMMGPRPWLYARTIWSTLIPAALLLPALVPEYGATAAAGVTAAGIAAYNLALIVLALRALRPR